MYIGWQKIALHLGVPRCSNGNDTKLWADNRRDYSPETLRFNCPVSISLFISISDCCKHTSRVERWVLFVACVSVWDESLHGLWVWAWFDGGMGLHQVPAPFTLRWGRHIGWWRWSGTQWFYVILATLGNSIRQDFVLYYHRKLVWGSECLA